MKRGCNSKKASSDFKRFAANCKRENGDGRPTIKAHTSKRAREKSKVCKCESTDRASALLPFRRLVVQRHAGTRSSPLRPALRCRARWRSGSTKPGSAPNRPPRSAVEQHKFKTLTSEVAAAERSSAGALEPDECSSFLYFKKLSILKVEPPRMCLSQGFFFFFFYYFFISFSAVYPFFLTFNFYASKYEVFFIIRQHAAHSLLNSLRVGFVRTKLY